MGWFGGTPIFGNTHIVPAHNPRDLRISSFSRFLALNSRMRSKCRAWWQLLILLTSTYKTMVTTWTVESLNFWCISNIFEGSSICNWKRKLFASWNMLQRSFVATLLQRTSKWHSFAAPACWRASGSYNGRSLQQDVGNTMTKSIVYPVSSLTRPQKGCKHVVFRHGEQSHRSSISKWCQIASW